MHLDLSANFASSLFLLLGLELTKMATICRVPKQEFRPLDHILSAVWQKIHKHSTQAQLRIQLSSQISIVQLIIHSPTKIQADLKMLNSFCPYFEKKSKTAAQVSGWELLHRNISGTVIMQMTL